MKTLKIQSILFFTFFIIIGNVSGQTYEWNENYAETIFIDNFSGSSLDRNKWNVAKFKRDIGLLIDSSATINVNNGKLELTMISCPNCEVTDWTGTTYYGNYAGAELVSKVAPFQYGIFECYAKYAQLGGSWPAFWIIGGDGTPCPPGAYENEIDIAEYFCKGTANNLQHNIHHYHPSSNCINSIHHLVNTKNYSYNGNNEYHYFKCVWTPNKISYFVDGILKHEVFNISQKCTETNQYWFPEFAMQLALSQQVTQPYNVLGQEINPTYPQTTYIDWVSVKRFFTTPVITCSDIICTSTTSTLDVVTEAYDITWSLTPTNLFSGAKTGTGKNASITAASGASGQGKITYTFKMPSNEIFTAEKTFWVGKPVINNISGPQNLSYGGNQIYTADVSGANGATYQWTVSPSLPLTSYGDNVEISFPSTNGDYVITLVVTGCGPSAPYYYYVATGENEINIIYPNPATDETTLSLASALPVNDLDNLQEWEYEIYTQNQSLKEKKTKLKGYTTKINTSGWKEGVYIVRVKYGKLVFQEKLIIER